MEEWRTQLQRSQHKMKELAGGADETLNIDFDVSAPELDSETASTTVEGESHRCYFSQLQPSKRSLCCNFQEAKTFSTHYLYAYPGAEAGAQEAGSKAELPGFSVRLAADLGEFALFVSGRTADVWWPDDVSISLSSIHATCA